MQTSTVPKKDWTALSEKSRVYLFQRMERENLFWTPLGLFSRPAIDYLLDKNLIYPLIIEEYDTERFYTWYNPESFWKWQKAKDVVYKQIKNNQTNPYHKIIGFCDNQDYLAIMRTGRLPEGRDINRGSLVTLAENCENIPLTDENKLIAKSYKYAEKTSKRIEEGQNMGRESISNEKLIEGIFKEHEEIVDKN